MQRGERGVGADDSAVCLEEPGLAGADVQWKAPRDLVPAEDLERDPRLGERVPIRPPVAEIERSVPLDQRLARLGLELVPERDGLLREPHPAGVGIGEPEDPGAPVARASVVADPKLLHEGDGPAGPRERPRRGEPHHAGSDDDDLDVRPAHPTTLQRARRRRSKTPGRSRRSRR